jgi:hypothetical protein
MFKPTYLVVSSLEPEERDELQEKADQIIKPVSDIE